MCVFAATSTGMPRKIEFTVVNSSSHEENFSARELMLHAPTVSGWRSSRYINISRYIMLFQTSGATLGT